jgi:hypothetical protein
MYTLQSQVINTRIRNKLNTNNINYGIRNVERMEPTGRRIFNGDQSCLFSMRTERTAYQSCLFNMRTERTACLKVYNEVEDDDGDDKVKIDELKL